MKTYHHRFDSKMELTGLDRIVLHLNCLWRDHHYAWHLAGIWRELPFRNLFAKGRH